MTTKDLKQPELWQGMIEASQRRILQLYYNIQKLYDSIIQKQGEGFLTPILSTEQKISVLYISKIPSVSFKELKDHMPSLMQIIDIQTPKHCIDIANQIMLYLQELEQEESFIQYFKTQLSKAKSPKLENKIREQGSAASDSRNQFFKNTAEANSQSIGSMFEKITSTLSVG